MAGEIEYLISPGKWILREERRRGEPFDAKCIVGMQPNLHSNDDDDSISMSYNIISVCCV